MKNPKKREKEARRKRVGEKTSTRKKSEAKPKKKKTMERKASFVFLSTEGQGGTTVFTT